MRKSYNKKKEEEKNIKLEVSDLWGRSGGARYPRRVGCGSSGSGGSPDWRKTVSSFRRSSFVIGCLIQEAEVQLGKLSDHLLLAELEALDEGSLADL